MKKNRLVKLGLGSPALDQIIDFIDLSHFDKFKVRMRHIGFFDETTREVVFDNKDSLLHFILVNTVLIVKEFYSTYDDDENYMLVFVTKF